MNNMQSLRFAAVCLVMSFLVIGCSQPAEEKAAVPTATEVVAVAKPDLAKMKSDIQALETKWAAADNARDAAAIAAFYADDAVSLSNDGPMQTGKTAIQKSIEENLASKVKGSTVDYTVMDVYGDENHITEVGKTTTKDANGKVLATSKYMAIWELRDGKYVCIRDIYNNDVKQK